LRAAWAGDKIAPTIRGAAMAKPPPFLLVSAALPCGATTALRQQGNFPDGPGKDTVVDVCGGCRDVNLVRAGYRIVP
jgi:hypothetical protein